MSPGSRPALHPLAVVLAVAIAAVAVIAVAPAVAESSTAAGSTTVAGSSTVVADGTSFQQDDDLESNGTVIRVTLQSDSDARWTIRHHFNVSTAVERAAFRNFSERFRSGEIGTRGVSAFRTSLARVEPTVERPMEITAVERNASAARGTVEVSFTWTNFAREVNETRIVDDAFTTRDGSWLGGLNADQTLVVELPGGSALDTPKRVSDGKIRWEGPTSFPPGYLEISYTADPPTSGIPLLVWVALGGLVVFAIAGVVGGYLISRRDGHLSLPSIPIDRSGSTDGGETVAESPETDEEPHGAAAATDAAEEESEDDGVDLSLLSDEERVEYLIEENGGRMKQANIVKETGWSNAKVSQLLSAMEEEGRITKLRIGRENLISFPDEDIGEFDDS